MEEKILKKIKKIAKLQAERISQDTKSIEVLLNRLEICNFFDLDKISKSEYSLITKSKNVKEFAKNLINNIAEILNIRIQIEEEIGKLRIMVQQD